MTVTATISNAGISAPPLSEILVALQNEYQQIFGPDVYLGSDSQDGEFLGIIAQLINDSNATAINVYNGFSPHTAVGTGLSSAVKINGLTRRLSTYSTVDVDVTGTVGTTINNGVVQDSNKNNWILPATATIGTDGSTTVTATAETPGVVQSLPGTVTYIITPTRGWQAVTNPNRAAPGVAVETDAELRQRQTNSVTYPAQGTLQSIIAAVIQIPGVGRSAVYENTSGSLDSNGISGHSVAIVIEGGAASKIGETIAAKKPPGTGLDGTTVVSTDNGTGVFTDVRFYRPTIRPVRARVTLTVLGEGYLAEIGNAIRQSVADYVNGLSIGADVYYSRLQATTILRDDRALTYDVTGVDLAFVGEPYGLISLPTTFTELATADVSNIELIVNAPQ